MKEGAVFINTARGALVDERALGRHLQSGKISGAGLDVLEDEANHDSDLIQMDNVIVTPHVGFLSDESILESRKIALEQIVTVLTQGVAPGYSVTMARPLIR
jgi:D-3-phosphoglycerate dehydrogenase